MGVSTALVSSPQTVVNPVAHNTDDDQTHDTRLRGPNPKLGPVTANQKAFYKVLLALMKEDRSVEFFGKDICKAANLPLNYASNILAGLRNRGLIVKVSSGKSAVTPSVWRLTEMDPNLGSYDHIEYKSPQQMLAEKKADIRPLQYPRPEGVRPTLGVLLCGERPPWRPMVESPPHSHPCVMPGPEQSRTNRGGADAKLRKF